jgi:hypothetical protein
MNNKTITLTASLLAGMLFFFHYQEWLTICWHPPYHHPTPDNCIKNKTIVVGREKNKTWTEESFQILWSNNPAETFTTLTTTWLSWLEAEHVISKKIYAESVLFSPSGYEMYVSFDQNPFDKQWSIQKKESFITALLKNYKENGCTASSVYFLVHHQPLKDPHLDFNKPWPLQASLP